MSRPTPLPYTGDVERLLTDEEAVIDETVRTMRHTMEQAFEKLRHQTPGTHAKAHGGVTGTVEVLPRLAPELAQGARTEENPTRLDQLPDQRPSELATTDHRRREAA